MLTRVWDDGWCRIMLRAQTLRCGEGRIIRSSAKNLCRWSHRADNDDCGSQALDYIGNVFPVQQVFGGETFKLVDVDVQRTFCDGRADARLGRIAVTDDFLSRPISGPS